MAAIFPLLNSSSISVAESFLNFNTGFLYFNALYNWLAVSVFFSHATSTVGMAFLPSEPKIQIRTMGKNKLKKIACGLLNVDFRLALVTASIARSWLYC